MDEQEIWVLAYLAAIMAGQGPDERWATANLAVDEHRERWDDDE